jgi:hypothetical protein
MSDVLKKERKLFARHQNEWGEAHPGKFVLVKGGNLVGVFDSADAAVTDGIRRFGCESFLVRNVFEREEEIRIPALMLGLINANH